MDMVWVDTMFPGLDPDEGWEKNLERVVNYDYLLKEYLDWQLKHLNTDNFNATDWANVEAEIISMAAGKVDLTAYYTKAEADAKAELTLEAAEAYTSAQLLAYYTAGDVDEIVSESRAALEAYADGKVAGLSLKAVTSGGTAQLVLQSDGSTVAGSGAQLALSVTNGNEYSTVSLTSGGVTLATSGQITLGGTVVFTGDNISRLNNNSGYQTAGGVTTIIGDTVTTGYINALDVTAKNLTGGTITGATIRAGAGSDYLEMSDYGWDLKRSGNSRAGLGQGSSSVFLYLGNSVPGYIEKYYGQIPGDATNKHYLWIGGYDTPWVNSAAASGLLIRLSSPGYRLYGSAF